MTVQEPQHNLSSLQLQSDIHSTQWHLEVKDRDIFNNLLGGALSITFVCWNDNHL